MTEKFVVKTDKNRGNTNKTLHAIALILTLTLTATLITCLPSANAATIATFAYISVAPNPIGVNQTALVTFWTSNVPPTGYAFEKEIVTITKPDNTTITKGPYKCDPVGSNYLYFTPDKVGTYYVQFSWPGQMLLGNTYKPAMSQKIQLTVQQQQLPQWNETPLPEPNDYWTRPINAENREWWRISGNWLMRAYDSVARSHLYGSAFNPYTYAPKTAHIVWTKPVAFGGIVGGEFKQYSYYTGLSYEMRLWDKIIIGGRLFYSTPDPPLTGFYCLDLRTGEQIWHQENGTIAMGQIYAYEAPNQHGALPYLWGFVGSVWSMYDAFTGNLILSLAPAEAIPNKYGGAVLSVKGELLVYFLSGAKNWLAMWNSSKAIPVSGAGAAEQWRPDMYRGQTLNWTKGIQWNVTVPDVPGTQSLVECTSDVIVATSTLPRTNDTELMTYVHVAYSLKTGEEGRQLWVQNRTIPDGASIWSYGCGAADGKYWSFIYEKKQTVCYDLYTGNELWTTEPMTSDWSIYSTGRIGAQGKYYNSGYDGTLYAYDSETGETLWTFNVPASGLETPYGQWPLYGGLTIADGKIYEGTGEHSPSMPLYRGEKLYCIDAETGKGLWNITGWFHQGVIADGYLAIMNVADNQLYCFGHGQTTTTISVTKSQISKGEPVGITGTILDQSPAQKNTPAIADKYMSEWMEYLNIQKPKPTNAIGVPVTLTAIKSDGSAINIGETYSDSNGVFRFQWTPTDQDLYEITATFKGSDSYFGSNAITTLMVEPAQAAPTAAPTPTPTVAPTPTPTVAPTVSPSPAVNPEAGSNTMLYVGIASVVLIAAVAAVALYLRRRK